MTIVQATYVLDERSGTALDAAIYQGYGDEYLSAYLRSKLPAGSPLALAHVALVDLDETETP